VGSGCRHGACGSALAYSGEKRDEFRGEGHREGRVSSDRS
jgi:hypothetical protein